MKHCIETKRLLLRPLLAQDRQDIVALVDDFEVSKWLTVVPFPYTDDDAGEFLNIVQAGYEFAITMNGKVLGVISITDSGQLGYWLGQSYWGQGIMSEAAFALCHAHFASPKARPLLSGYFVENDKSASILRRLGFSNLGTPELTHCCARGQDVPLQHLGLTPEQWHFIHGLSLVGDIVTIVPVKPRHAADLFDIFRHKSVSENMASFDHPLEMRAIRDRIDNACWKGGGNGWFHIQNPQGQGIGAIGFHTVGDGVADIGYALHPDHNGHGYMSDAVGVFCNFLFERYGFNEIIAEHFQDNPASGRVMIKNGFEKYAESEGQSKARLEPARVNLYRLRNPN